MISIILSFPNKNLFDQGLSFKFLLRYNQFHLFDLALEVNGKGPERRQNFKTALCMFGGSESYIEHWLCSFACVGVLYGMWPKVENPDSSQKFFFIRRFLLFTAVKRKKMRTTAQSWRRVAASWVLLKFNFNQEHNQTSQVKHLKSFLFSLTTFFSSHFPFIVKFHLLFPKATKNRFQMIANVC